MGGPSTLDIRVRKVLSMKWAQCALHVGYMYIKILPNQTNSSMPQKKTGIGSEMRVWKFKFPTGNHFPVCIKLRTCTLPKKVQL